MVKSSLIKNKKKGISLTITPFLNSQIEKIMQITQESKASIIRDILKREIPNELSLSIDCKEFLTFNKK